ncbi:hypothetical protein BC628DRAFT_507532 [Trametes gibbosa]|nr:hypothetical protein BC628DRAFT_507532 [Trametes gibbosa]
MLLLRLPIPCLSTTPPCFSGTCPVYLWAQPRSHVPIGHVTPSGAPRSSCTDVCADRQVVVAPEVPGCRIRHPLHYAGRPASVDQPTPRQSRTQSVTHSQSRSAHPKSTLCTLSTVAAPCAPSYAKLSYRHIPRAGKSSCSLRNRSERRTLSLDCS